MNEPPRLQPMIVLNRRVAIIVAIAFLGVCQFCILTGLAIMNYRGPNAAAYSVTEQFLSYLGAESSNVQWMFNTALVVLGLSLIPFFVIMPSIDRRDSPAMKFAAIAGFLSAIGLIGLGGTPVDFDTYFHNAMLAVWIVQTPIIIVCFLIATIGTTANKWFVRICLLLVVSTIVYPILFPPQNNVILQKVGVCMSLIWFLAISWFVFRSAYFVLMPSEAAIRRAQENEYFQTVGRRYGG